MSALSVIEFVSLDGVVQGFHGADERDGFRHSGWGADYQDQGQFDRAVDRLPATGVYLLGRRTYDELSQFWPFQPDDNPMAAHLNRRPKYVVTHQDDELAWPNARRLEGDLVDAVTRLKAAADGDIAVLGSGALVQQLLAANLVDQFHLYMHPLVLGGGHELFPRVDRPVRLRLEEVGRTTTGVVELRYAVEHSMR
jgi:dihydrofolate reductase